MQFIVFGPAFAGPGDEVTVVDDIKPGDIIQFVRVDPANLELRHAGDGPEQRYRVKRGEEPGTIVLHALVDAAHAVTFDGLDRSGNGEFVSAPTHQAKTLWEGHRAVAPYPEGVLPVPEPIRGNAFFPGGFGLWKERPDDALPRWPEGGVMVLGHDFHSEMGYRKSLEQGQEPRSQPTWRNLLALFDRAGIDRTECFFTNAYMGLRKGNGTTGPFPGRKDRAFVQRCQAFLRQQFALQSPRLIVVLGRPAAAFLSETLSELAPWGSAKTFRDIDGPNGLGALRQDVPVSNSVTASVVALIHPSLRWASVRTRRFGEHEGDEAEVRLLQAGLSRA